MIMDITDQGGSAEPIQPLADMMFGAATEAQRVSRILDFADFCGWQDDDQGGRFELWTLRKPLGIHPKGSTIARSTLDRLLRKTYGTFTASHEIDQNLAAIESPTDWSQIK